MLRRMWHWLVVGHRWKMISNIYMAGTGRAPILSDYMVQEHHRHATWGWTDIIWACPCGKQKRTRLTGDHTKITSLSEVDELERMFRKS